jgi:aspartyl protease family protein
MRTLDVGLITIRMQVRRDGGSSREVEFLVDSGATLTVLPRDVWRALGLHPKRAMRFALADGRTIRRRVSECRFCYQGIDAVSPVVLGQRRDAALLGALTLESLGLVLHPFERRLAPMRMMLAASVQDPR